MCHDLLQAALPRPPLIAWHCRNCGETTHSGNVSVVGEGRDDFVRSKHPEMDAHGWPDVLGGSRSLHVPAVRGRNAIPIRLRDHVGS